MRAVVNRYGGRIAAYQIWNEANIPQFWRGTPELMADLTARAYAVIKKAQPGAVVVAASTGSRWVKGFTEFYPEYLTALGECRLARSTRTPSTCTRWRPGRRGTAPSCSG